MLGEATTTKFTKDRNSEGFSELKKDARDGGDVAGRTRTDIEARSGEKILSHENFLETPESHQQLQEHKNK